MTEITKSLTNLFNNNNSISIRYWRYRQYKNRARLSVYILYRIVDKNEKNHNLISSISTQNQPQ